MNKIYKVVKSRSTGCFIAVSELAKGIKKGKKLTLVALIGALSYPSYAATGIAQGFTPEHNSNQAGRQEISGSGQKIDLGLNNGLNDTKKGKEAKEHTIRTKDTIISLYQIKYTNVTNAINNYNTTKNSFNNGYATQAELDTAKNELDNAKNKASLISDDKFKISDPNNLIGSNTEGIKISETEMKYSDPVTGKAFQIEVKTDLVKTQAASIVADGEKNIDFYEKTPKTEQYDNMQMLNITGNNTDVTIINTAGAGTNDQLNAISKNGSGVIRIEDGANLTFDANISYYTGGYKSTSKAFEEKEKYNLDSSNQLYKIDYKGNVNTILGQKNITSVEDVNKFNAELIKYIKTNEQIRFDYPTPELMQEFYNAQIAGLYTLKLLGSYDINFSLTDEELKKLAKDQKLENEFNNKVTKDDKGKDIGLDFTDDNYFTGIKGSGSVITVNEGSTINNTIITDNKENQSSGTVFKADFANSGEIKNNIFNINGTIDANNGDAIVAKNAELNVSKTGIIKGRVSILGNGNIIDNKGIISGQVKIENGKVNNHTDGVIKSIIAGQNVTITNGAGGSIIDGIIADKGSTVLNQENAVIGGAVIVKGNGTSFINNGISGGAYAANGASATNNNLIIGNSVDGQGFVGLNDSSTFKNESDIYVGYIYDQTTTAINAAGKNDKAYAAMKVAGNGTELVNNKNIYVSSTQHDVDVVSVSNSAKYSDTVNSVIILNKGNETIGDIDLEKGNNNKAVKVSNSGTDVTIKGTVTLNDIGSTALWIDDKANLTLSGTVNINSQNTSNNAQIRNFGVWVQGDGAKFTMNGNSLINMNADRAIGVHIRDGATAKISDHAEIKFADKKYQIGFLVSGISKEATIDYQSDKDIKLNGEGSILFRVERGSLFNSKTVANGKLSTLDSNNTKNSTLVVITNGGVATGANNQTEANLDGFTLNVNGEGAKGISVEGGAHATITENTSIKLTGQDSILARVDGWYYDLNGKNQSSYNGATNLKSSANLTTDLTTSSGQIVSGQNSVGYYVTHGATLEHKGSIDFDAPSKNNIGVKIDSGGTLISEKDSFIKVNGTAIEISGSNSLATINNVSNGNDPVIWAIGDTGNNSDSAYHLKDAASLKLTGVGLTKAEGTAHGILVDGASKIILDSAILDLYSNSVGFSSGNGIENRSSLINIQFINNARIDVKDGYGIHSSIGFSQNSQTSGVINVYGQGTGIRFEGIDSTNGNILGTTNNSINNTGYEKVLINVFENTGHGIYVDSSKNVNTSASVNIISDTGRSALEIKGSTETASQSGNLYSANKNTVIVDLNNGHVNKFTNNGALLFGGFNQNSSGQYIFTAQDKDTAKNSYAIKTQSTENGLNFTNDTKGKINSTVELLGYGDQSDPNDKTKGNTVTLRGEGNIFKTGDGNDKFIIERAVGDDLGGVNQVKQFTKLDGGDGDDQIFFTNNSNFTINNDDTIKNIQYFALNNNSKVILNNLSTVDGLNSEVTTYDIIDATSVLTYKWNNSNTHFDRLLQGNGTFKVDLQNVDSSGKPSNQFAFNNSTNTGDFKGTLELTNTNFTLKDTASNLNTTALTQATLKAGDNSYVKVGEGDQNIKGLTVSGGTVDFGNVDLANETSNNHVTVDNLVLDKGNIQIDVSGSIYNPNIPTSLPILEQDNGIIFTQLVSANNVSGGAINIDIDRSKIKLLDQNGVEVQSQLKTDLMQNGENVARATYDTRLSKGTQSDGLYIGYGLTQIELKTKNDGNGNGNALILDATNSDPTKAGSSDLDTLVTDYDNGNGTFSYGDLQIRGNKAVTLSGTNSYHGSTFVKDTSSLISGANNALGFTRLLKLDSNTKFDLNHNNQILGSLFTSTGSMVDINGGHLTISGEDGTDSSANLDSYISAGSLTGAGTLIVGDTSLTRATSKSPRLTINGDNSGLTANVINAVNGKIDMNTQGALGSGNLTNNGELNLYFVNDSILTNTTLNGNGILNKFNANSLTFTLPQAKDYTGEVNIKGGTIIFKGDNNTTTDGYATNKVNITSNGTLVGLDNAVLQGNINNSGQFYIAQLPGSTTVNQNTVTVNDYNGNSDSHLIFNGKLTDDSSAIGKLTIKGNSSGSSIVTVNNIGGLGAKTINGIAIIDVNGQSDAEFTQSGRIIAGAYEYKLQRSQSNNSNWVLFSDLTKRSEIGSYIGNLFSANNLFNLRLHDRLGETQYTDLLTGEQKVTSMWMRHQYGYNKYKAGDGDLAVKNTWNISQFGGDIAQWSSNDLNRLHLGVMVGYGRSKTKSTSTLVSSKSDGTLDGYSYGAYATWYDNDQDKTGLYIDTWALWNDFDASVSGKELSEKYKAKGLTASIESGYSFRTGTLGNYDVWLQPKGQLIWADVKADDFTEKNGTRVSFNHGNLQSRLGLRASLLSNEEIQTLTNQSGQFFIEANWLHNTKLYDVTLNDDLTIAQDGARNIAELKVGVEGNIHKNTNIWFNLAGQKGDHDYKNASVMLGLKYSF